MKVESQCRDSRYRDEVSDAPTRNMPGRKARVISFKEEVVEDEASEGSEHMIAVWENGD